MATKRVPIELDFSANTSKAQKSIRILNQELDDLLKSISKNNDFTIDKDLHKASVAAIELKQHLQNALNPETGKFDVNALNNSFKSMGRTLKDYREELSKAGAEGQQAFNNLAKEIVNAEVPLKRTNALLADFADTLQKTAKWQISSRLFNAFVGSLQEAYYYAQDLNESLNNIRIVTGKNIDQMAQFAKEANKAAQALSTTTTEYTNASLIYYQQGLSDSEVKERTDVTIKMANVSRESAETVSQQMTAVWNNFDNGSKSLEYYADVMTALGAATASSSAEIAEGLEKFAAIADTVGLSYEYATAALATVTATTRQSADIVGNSFKTLFARIQSLKLGETLDDGTTLNNYSQALAAVGISIKNTDGQLKDMNDILDEMGDKWTKLGKDQQVALAQTVAGVRQYSQLIALMDNWSFFQQNLGVAEGAEGTLEKQAEIYAESWEAASDRVKAAAEEIYDQLLNDKFFIWLNNAFTGLLNLISNTVDALGGLKGVLSGIGLLLTRMYGKSLIESVSNFFMTQEKRYNQWFNAQEVALNELQANYRKLGAYESATNFNQIYEAQIALKERVNELSEDQVKKLQEEINLLKLRNEEMQKTELIYNQAERNKENTYRDVQLKTQKFNVAENRTESQIGRVLNIKNENVDKGKLKSAIDEYQKASGSFKNLAEKARVAKKAIKEINEALGEAKTDKLFNGESIVENIDAANDAAIELEKAIKKDDEAKEHLKNSMDDLNDSARAFDKTNTDVRKNIKEAEPRAAEMSDVITGMVQGVTSLTMAFSALKGMIDVWNDDDLSVGEKLLSTLTSLTIVIPSLTAAYKALAISKIKVDQGSAAEIILNSSLVKSLFGVTAAEGAATAGTVAFDVALKSLIWPLTLITGAVVGLAFAFKAIKEASPEGQLKKAKETAEELKTAFEETKQKAEDLISTFDKYDNLISTLHDCTVGTEEWKEALEKVNEQVLELLDKYPELMQYVKTGKNGELYFEEEDINDVINTAKKNQTTAQYASLYGNLNVKEASQKVLFSDIKKEFGDKNSLKDILPTIVGGVLTLPSSGFGSIPGVVGGIIDTYAAQNVFKNHYEELANLTKEQYIEKLKEFGIEEDIAEKLTEYQNEINELVKNQESINKNYKILGQSIAAQTLDSTKYNEFETVYAGSQLEDLIQTIKSNIKEQKGINIASGSNDKDVEALWKRYQKASGTSYELATSNAVRGGDKHRSFAYMVGGDTKLITLEEMATTIAIAEATEKLGEQAEKAKKALQNLRNKTNNNNAKGIEYFLLNGNFGNLTEEEWKGLKKSVGEEVDEQFLKDLFGVEDLTPIAQMLGKETSEQLVDAFNEGLSNYDEIVNNYKAGMLEVTRRAFDQLDADGKFKELTPDIQKSVMNILETAFNSRKNEGLSVIKGLFDDMDSTQIESFVGAIEDIDDWTNITSEDLENLLKDNGIELKLIGDQWELLLDSLKQSPYIISNVTKKYKELHDTLDKLQFGTEWDKSTYDKFGGDEKLGDYFLKAADGTYKFIGSLEELNKVYLDLNKETVKDFKKNIKQYQTVLGNGEDYYKQSLIAARWQLPVASELTDENGYGVTLNSDLIEDYLQLLEVAGEDTSDWRSKQTLHQLREEDAIAIQEAVNNVDFSQLTSNLPSEMEHLASSAQSFKELDDLLKEGLITEEIYDKVLKMAKNSVDIAEYERDRYAHLNKLITTNNTELEKNSSLQQELNTKKKYYKDQSLVNIIAEENENLKNANSLLNQQIGAYELLRKEQEKEYAELEEELIGLSSDGSIVYDKIAEGIYDAYEKAMQEASLKNNETEKKNAQKKAEEEFNARLEKLKRYEELYYNEMVETENNIEDFRQKQFENNISFIENQFEAINAGVNRTFRLAEVKKEYQDFLKTINSDFNGVIDKDYSNEKELFGISEEELTAQKKRLTDFSTEVQNLIAQGMDEDIVNSLAEDTYIDIYKEITSLASNFYQLQQNAWNNYLKGFDNLSTQLDHVNNRAKRYTKELEYQKQLIELMYGDKAYDLMNDYYTSQSKNITSQIQSMQQQYDFWVDQYESLKNEIGETFDVNNIDTWNDAIKKAYDGMISSQEELNNLIVSGLQNFKDTYLNEVAKTISNLDNAVWGRDFDALKADWDYVQNRAKNYLDEVTSAYKIQTLSNKIDMSISETSSLKAQQKLMQLKEEELEYLREKDNLTQDDLDIAEARYQVALKEIALEESQRNKTSMKLTRDASGNWSYQYVADQDDILKKQQDLLDANQNLYEVSNRAYTNAIQLAIDTYDEYKQKLIEIANDTVLTEEEKNEKMQELQNTYLKDMEIAMSNANIYSHNQFMDITNSAQTLAAEVIKTWSNNPGGVEFEFKNAINNINEATEILNQNIQGLNYLARDILGEDGIKNAFTQVDTEVDKVNKEISKLCGKDSETIKELDNLKTIVDDLANAWGTGENSVKGQIEAAYKSLDEYLKLYDERSTKTTNNSSTETSSEGETAIVPSLKIDTQTGSTSDSSLKTIIPYANPEYERIKQKITEFETIRTTMSQTERAIIEQMHEAQSSFDSILSRIGNTTIYNTNEESVSQPIIIDTVKLENVNDPEDLIGGLRRYASQYVLMNR